MSNQESENYLDQLLNSISGKESEPPKENPITKMNLFGENVDEDEKLLREMDEKMGVVSTKAEEDFLEEFERELLQPDEAISDVLKGLRDIEPEPLDMDDLMGIDQIVVPEEPIDFSEAPSILPEEVRESLTEPDMPVESVEEEALEERPEQAEILKQPEAMPETVMEEPSEEVQEELPEEELPVEEPPLTEEIPLTDDGEPDLAGMNDEDLIDLLSSSDDLSELGALLNADGTMESIDENDTIEEFAEQEMRKQEESVSIQEPKKKEKGGFLKKIKDFFFGPEEEETVDITPGGEVSAESLSEENSKILAQLEEEEKNTSTKGKKEKPKKEKKPKAAKPKKEKPKKEKKPKKVKPPKPVDNTPPLPKGPVIMIFVMAASLGVLIFLGGTLLTYSSDIQKAQTLYNNAAYVEAYDVIAGTDVKEKDEALYQRIVILSNVQAKIDSYEYYSKQGNQPEAFDALVCALGRCKNNEKGAETYECEKELERMRTGIAAELQNRYAMSEEETLEIYNQRTRKEYTLALQKKIKELGLE